MKMLKDVVYQQPLGHQNRQLNQNQDLTTKLSQSNLCVTEMVGFSVQVVVAGQGGCKRQAMDWRVDTMLPAREPAAGKAGIGIRTPFFVTCERRIWVYDVTSTSLQLSTF